MSRIKNLKQRIRDFFITNAFCRKIKIIFNGIIKLIIIRLSLLIIAGFVLVLSIIYWLKPSLILQIKNRALGKFYHILKLDELKFSSINISGNNRVSKDEIIVVIKDFGLNNGYFTHAKDLNATPNIQYLINELKTKLPWIDKIVIKRTIPDIINIEITEYQPFAIWLDDNQKYIIDKDGNLIPFLPEYDQNSEFANMIILSGRGANKNAKSLFNILAINSEISQEIYSANWVGDRRWDIRFFNGMLVKLPEANIEKAWHDLIKLYLATKNNKLIKSIDLRVGGKIYLKYDDHQKIEQVKTINS